MKPFGNDQIKYMVNRFLSWRLPDNFAPDAGISFKPVFNEHTSHPMKHEPTGTNLFDAVQTEEMIRYLIEGLPVAQAPAASQSELLGAQKHLETCAALALCGWEAGAASCCIDWRKSVFDTSRDCEKEGLRK